jgi:hypothetical protein
MPTWTESTGCLAAYGVAGILLTLAWLLVVIRWERKVRRAGPALASLPLAARKSAR